MFGSGALHLEADKDYSTTIFESILSRDALIRNWARVLSGILLEVIASSCESISSVPEGLQIPMI